MELPINEIINSKIYTKESKVSFQSPRAYIQPFLDIVKTNNITCKVQNPVTNTNEDGSINTAYPRVVVEAHVGQQIEGYDSVLGMIFALDLQSPVIKVYTGQNAHACTNLTIFQANQVSEHSLMNDYSDIYRKAESYVQNKELEIAKFLETRQRLIDEFYNEEQLKNELGRLLLTTTKKSSKLGYTAIAGAAKLMQDRSSIYFLQKGESCSKMNLYDAITQNITDSPDILHKPNKTIAVSQLLNIN